VYSNKIYHFNWYKAFRYTLIYFLSNAV